MIKQISVFLENKKGTMYELTGKLNEAKVNIRAFAVFDTVDFGILRFITEEVEEAAKKLEEEGFSYTVHEVVAIEIEDSPGAFHEVLRILKNGDLNIDYMYSLVIRDNMEPLLILGLDDNEKGEKILLEHGIKAT